MTPFQNTIMVNFIRCQEEDSQEVFLFMLPLVVDVSHILMLFVIRISQGYREEGAIAQVLGYFFHYLLGRKCCYNIYTVIL